MTTRDDSRAAAGQHEVDRDAEPGREFPAQQLGGKCTDPGAWSVPKAGACDQPPYGPAPGRGVEVAHHRDRPVETFDTGADAVDQLGAGRATRAILGRGGVHTD